ncbi:MAG: ParB/RepB/Spo0J family partition protein [Desulfobacula sp.]|jgi:ParB family chromosome partitioning protein|uniref:ParB/RepB/Spo0J family partition protein n=1 Tax=Desulfobacula sp. TaxID=2593537 RepID=UPI001D632713|nr:ParB/RepB/Spo0J family partition protein [Desulfobacula sp.]MBT3484306.1 ParB/RepB/Spo0J family partition protein [Desulfobacula sp.]MBT3805017.1 ParB/RepB/Spo0J family partition protein [Desulfobacula sp.]MBT4024101.1 ParB/RepB/Spo0J family partition protein [Desulfobacula sp.]MBT4197425.1 ParB/RepB/Spo0J family partition protein [Desulfobacula sp.]
MMKKKKKNTGLGRGLSALIPDYDMPESSPDFFMCAIGEIKPNRYQPRTIFNQEELDRLKESIAQKGILQPLLVRRLDDSYELIAGERRLRAAREAQLTHVPVFVKDLTDEQVLEVSIIENIQREDLNVLEEGEAYYRLIKEFNYTQEKVAKKIGKNRSTIANLLRLRSLPQEIKDSLIAEKISMGHARALLGAGSEESQIYLLHIVLKKELSVRQTEQLVKKAKNEPQKFQKKISATEKQFLEETCSMISNHIQSKVKIQKNGDKGKIEIKFKSKTEFQRLVDLLTNIS